jgi:tetratricopeptide (TPR) repeat protein
MRGEATTRRSWNPHETEALSLRRVVKVIIYAVLIISAVILARGFASEHLRVTEGVAAASKSLMMEYFGGFLATIAILGPLCAYDLSHFFGDRAEQWILQGGAPTLPVAARRPLAAVESFREYLRKNPGEWRAKARVAEIYNSQLKNYPAAMLEYEEVLASRPDPEAWGWAALHLAKIYSRLNRPEQAEKLLNRLETEFGRTLAARRARHRLEKFDRD